MFQKLLKKNPYQSSKSRVICFKIENFEEAYKKDHLVIEKLERSLVYEGIFPAKIDFPSKLCCVTSDPTTLDLKKIMNVFKKLGLHAKKLKDNHPTNRS
jgi:hypothetical protein